MTYVEEIKFLRNASPPLPWWAWRARRRYRAPVLPRLIDHLVAQMTDHNDARAYVPIILRAPSDTEVMQHIGVWYDEPRLVVTR